MCSLHVTRTLSCMPEARDGGVSTCIVSIKTHVRLYVVQCEVQMVCTFFYHIIKTRVRSSPLGEADTMFIVVLP